MLSKIKSKKAYEDSISSFKHLQGTLKTSFKIDPTIFNKKINQNSNTEVQSPATISPLES